MTSRNLMQSGHRGPYCFLGFIVGILRTSRQSFIAVMSGHFSDNVVICISFNRLTESLHFFLKSLYGARVVLSVHYSSFLNILIFLSLLSFLPAPISLLISQFLLIFSSGPDSLVLVFTDLGFAN